MSLRPHKERRTLNRSIRACVSHKNGPKEIRDDYIIDWLVLQYIQRIPELCSQTRSESSSSLSSLSLPHRVPVFIVVLSTSHRSVLHQVEIGKCQVRASRTTKGRPGFIISQKIMGAYEGTTTHRAEFKLANGPWRDLSHDDTDQESCFDIFPSSRNIELARVQFAPMTLLSRLWAWIGTLWCFSNFHSKRMALCYQIKFSGIPDFNPTEHQSYYSSRLNNAG